MDNRELEKSNWGILLRFCCSCDTVNRLQLKLRRQFRFSKKSTTRLKRTIKAEKITTMLYINIYYLYIYI